MATSSRGRHRTSGTRYRPPIYVIQNTIWLLGVVTFLARVSVSARGLGTVAAGLWLAVATLVVMCPAGRGGRHRASRTRPPRGGGSEVAP